MQNWKRIGMYKYGDDEFGVVAYFGREPTPADLAHCFEGTTAAAWGNVLKNKPAGGVYGEIISGIKRCGFGAFVGDGNDWRSRIKNKSERYFNSMEVRKAKVKRLIFVEPAF